MNWEEILKAIGTVAIIIIVGAHVVAFWKNLIMSINANDKLDEVLDEVLEELKEMRKERTKP